MQQTSLILEGGGMRGAFTAGVLDCFLDHKIYIPHVYGVSAGACQACSYLSEQKGRGLRVWVNYLQDKRFCSFSSLLHTGNLFDVSFNYDLIPNVLDPVNHEAYLRHAPHFYAVVTNLRTGHAEYLPVRDLRKDMSAVQASASLPLLSLPVSIGNDIYLDGGVADPIPLKRAISDGHQKNIIVLTRTADYQKEATHFMLPFQFRYRHFPAFLSDMKNRHNTYNDSLALVENEKKAGRVFVIRPKTAPDIGRIEKNPQKLIALHHAGYETAQERIKALLGFLHASV